MAIPVTIDQLVYRPDAESGGKVKVVLFVDGAYLSDLKDIADVGHGSLQGPVQEKMFHVPHKTYHLDPGGDNPRLVEDEHGNPVPGPAPAKAGHAPKVTCHLCGVVRPEAELRVNDYGLFECAYGCEADAQGDGEAPA